MALSVEAVESAFVRLLGLPNFHYGLLVHISFVKRLMPRVGIVLLHAALLFQTPSILLLSWILLFPFIARLWDLDLHPEFNPQTRRRAVVAVHLHFGRVTE